MDGQQPPQSDQPSWQFKPGETVSPRQMSEPSVSAAPTPPTPPETSPAPQKVETPPAPQSTVAAPAPTPLTQPAEATPVASPPSPEPWPQPAAPTNNDQQGAVSWSASEFISRQKTGGWHTAVIFIFLAAAALVGFIFRDIVSAVVIILAGAALSYYGGRKPLQVNYQLSHQGLIIGNKQFLFSDFRAFSVVPDGAFETIQLLPAKRFMPMTTLFFDPQDGDKIIDVIGSHLPHQERQADAIDNLMRRIRF